MRHLKKKTIVLLLLSGLISLSCDLLEWDGDPEPEPNVLNTKDSLAIRAILDTNGLYDIEVHDVINLYNSTVNSIHINYLKSTAFLFTSSFDSLTSGSIGVYLTYEELDTLIFKDTVHIPLSLSISDTKLKSIPDHISYLTGNLSLDLQNNQLSFISSYIMECKVSIVNVRNNYICDVSDSLKNWLCRYSYDSTWQEYQNCN